MDNVQSAGFLHRFVAVVFEVTLLAVIILLPLYLLLGPTLNAAYFEGFTEMGIPSDFGPIANYLVFTVAYYFFVIAVYFVYAVYFTSTFGGTIGKILTGLRVVNASNGKNVDLKTAFYRHTVGYAFSTTFLYLGFFRIIKNEQKLAWHDELFGTKVTSKGNLGILIGLGLCLLAIGILIYLLGLTALLIDPYVTAFPVSLY